MKDYALDYFSNKSIAMEIILQGFITILEIYFLIGILFGIVFIFKGIGQVDEDAKGSSIATRLLLLPGSIAFWSVLLIKWIKSRK